MKPIEVEPRVTKELNIVARDYKRDLVPCRPVGGMSIYVRELSGPVSSPNVLVHTYGVIWGVTWEFMLGDFCEGKGLGTSLIVQGRYETLTRGAGRPREEIRRWQVNGYRNAARR